MLEQSSEQLSQKKLNVIYEHLFLYNNTPASAGNGPFWQQNIMQDKIDHKSGKTYILIR